MKFTIKHPEYLMIEESLLNKDSFGGDQAWYPKAWARKAGCGATCAANITAYLALTREKYASLYQQTSKSRDDFLKHMEELYRYVKPGPMGVNHIEKYKKGVLKYAKAKGVTLQGNTLSTEKNTKHQRSAEELIRFTKNAMLADSPIAFLNLSRGDETHLQDWHWITITSTRMEEGSILATASDEGKVREFDLLLWYVTTTMHGGLVYFE